MSRSQQKPLTEEDPFGKALHDLLKAHGIALFPDSAGEVIMVEHADEWDEKEPLSNVLDCRK